MTTDPTPTLLTNDECDRLIIAIFEPDDDCAHNMEPLYAEVADMLSAARADERERMLTPWFVLRRVAQTMPHNPEAVDWLHIQADGWEASGVIAAPVETDLRGDALAQPVPTDEAS